MVAALLLGLLGWTQGVPVARTSDPVRLHVRVYADRGVDRSTVQRSQEVARQLLASAGIDLVWRLCDPTSACALETRPPHEVVVILTTEALRNGFENCGRTARGTEAGSGAARVSVSCVAGVVARLASRSGTVHPLLKMARYDDVLGAVEAHELGHVLGLKHAGGVMHARLDPNDIVALRSGVLAFSASQSARMRVVLAEPKAEELAAGPNPKP